MARAVFRVDASDRIGSGHVSRCLVLAEALRDAGMHCEFVCADQPGHLGDLIGTRGFPLHWIAAADWQTDADATSRVLEEAGGADWLVVDHYGLDARWERSFAAKAGGLFVIDDLADRPHLATLLLDQNLVAEQDSRYAALLPSGARTLLGPDYALLQPDYRSRHAQVSPRSGPIRRVLLHFGATDPHGLCVMALRALLQAGDPSLAIDVAPPRDAEQRAAIQELATGHAGIRVHDWLPSLAPLVAAADLGIGACGVSSWERLCLGLPTLAVVVADNQREIAAELARRSLVRLLGEAGDMDEPAFVRALAPLLQQGLSPEWSRACLATVDGLGAARVAAAMCSNRDTPLRARPVRPADEARLLGWANDPVTRANAFNPERIDEATHHAWFQRRLQDGERCRFYVLETSTGAEVGSVRFQREGAAWEIHFSLAPAFRGRGLGTPLVATAIRQWQADTIPAAEVFGRVMPGNIASRRIFEALGFTAGPTSESGALSFRRTG